MNHGSRRGGGFSLVELLIALAVVVILAGIALPSYLEFVRRGWRSEARSALTAQMQLQERHFTAEGRYRPYEGGSGEGGGRYAIRSGACEDHDSLDDCVLLRAVLRPGLRDPAVGGLWLDSMGRKGCDGARPEPCWDR